MGFLLSKLKIREVVRFVLVFLVILLAAKAGQYFFFEWKSSPAVLWPPTGIGLAILWLGGYRYAVPIFLGILVSSVTGPTAYLIPAVVTTPAAQVLGQIAGAYLLKRFNFDGSLARLKNVGLVLLVFIVACMIAPTITTAISWATGNLTTTAYFSWSRAWSGYVFSCLILFPLIVSLVRPDEHFYKRRYFEYIAVALLLFLSVYFLFWTRVVANFSFIVFGAYFIAHFWVGLRFSTRAMTLSVFCTTVLSIMGLVFSPNPDRPLNTQLFNTELFLMLLVPIFYMFSAVVKERLNVVLELKRAMQRLEHESSIKNEFIAVLAHELRNPLAPVKTTLEILSLQNLEPDMKKLIHSTTKQVHSMRRLLDDLLDVTRVTQGKFQLRIERANLCAMLRESIQATKDICDDRKQTVIFDHNCNESIWLDVDPVRFEQVIVNIINNAAKYTEPGGRIEISHAVQDGLVELKIKDNGEGIDTENLQDIFEPFWQKNASGRSTTGIGIGLTLTKRIVEMHGGTIQVESAGKGSGTTFIIQMPCSVLNDDESRPQAAAPKRTTLPAKFTILVVDDNEVAAEALKKLLRLKGHEAEAVYSGSAALETIQASAPDLILLDIGMPEMNGYEVAQKLRASGFAGTIVALSGYGQEDDIKKAFDSGFDHHFTKPIAIARLEEYFSTLKN